MAIENGTYIKLTYTGSINGVPFDTTDAEAAKKGNIFREGFNYTPAIVKVGAGRLLKGLDEELVGKEIGQEYTVVLPAEKAFGPHLSEEVKAVDKKAIDHKPELYERVVVEGREGVIVNKIGSRYIIDYNHPLAGQDVEYVFKIEGIVEDALESLKGTIKLITGREMKVSATKTAVTVEIPTMIAMYNQNWFMTQYLIMQEALDLFPDVNNVKFVESFPRPKAEGEEKPAAKKTAKKAAEKTEE